MSEQGGNQPLCQDCGVNAAVGTVAVMMGAKMIHRKLCQACMAKTSMAIASGNLGQILGSLMAAARAVAPQNADTPVAEAPQPKPAEAPLLPDVPADAAACPACGMTREQLRKGGRLGCAACAAAFRGTLAAALSTGEAALQHTGRRPVSGADARRERAQREDLQRRLEEAIALEEYETAAQLRDALRQLDQRRAQHGA